MNLEEINIGIIINIAIICIFTTIACKITDIIFDKLLKKNSEIHFKFTRSVMKAMLYIIGACTVGMQFQVTAEISKALIQSTSLLVAVVGFAAQSVLSDVISGMMISWCKPYNIGERITVKSTEVTGIVEDITIRHTVIRCFDNTRVIIPNSIINKEVLINSNFTNNYIGNYMEVSVSYGSNLTLAVETMKNTILNHELVRDKSKDENCDKELYISVKDLGASGIVLKATIWTDNVDDSFIACSDLRLQIKLAFDIMGIKIPYNTMHVEMENV